MFLKLIESSSHATSPLFDVKYSLKQQNKTKNDSNGIDVRKARDRYTDIDIGNEIWTNTYTLFTVPIRNSVRTNVGNKQQTCIHHLYCSSSGFTCFFFVGGHNLQLDWRIVFPKSGADRRQQIEGSRWKGAVRGLHFPLEKARERRSFSIDAFIFLSGLSFNRFGFLAFGFSLAKRFVEVFLVLISQFFWISGFLGATHSFEIRFGSSPVDFQTKLFILGVIIQWMIWLPRSWFHFLFRFSLISISWVEFFLVGINLVLIALNIFFLFGFHAIKRFKSFLVLSVDWDI